MGMHALAPCMHAWWVLDSMVMQLCFELTQTSIAYNLSPHIYIYIYIYIYEANVQLYIYTTFASIYIDEPSGGSLHEVHLSSPCMVYTDWRDLHTCSFLHDVHVYQPQCEDNLYALAVILNFIVAVVLVKKP